MQKNEDRARLPVAPLPTYPPNAQVVPNTREQIPFCQPRQPLHSDAEAARVQVCIALMVRAADVAEDAGVDVALARSSAAGLRLSGPGSGFDTGAVAGAAVATRSSSDAARLLTARSQVEGVQTDAHAHVELDATGAGRAGSFGETSAPDERAVLQIQAAKRGTCAAGADSPPRLERELLWGRRMNDRQRAEVPQNQNMEHPSLSSADFRVRR